MYTLFSSGYPAASNKTIQAQFLIKIANEATTLAKTNPSTLSTG
jgi:hypothetical protein